MPLTGDRAREYQRKYKRTTRAAAKLAAKAIAQAAGHMGEGRPLTLASVEATGIVGQGVLKDVLRQSNLGLDRLASKLSDKVDAKRPVGSQVGEDGKAILADDNDAQLRAIDMGLRLHERAGTIPASSSPAGGGGNITLIEVIYQQAPQDVVCDTFQAGAITSNARKSLIT